MSEVNLRLIRRWFEVQTAHDLDAMAELFVEDVIYEDVALGLVKNGPAEVVEMMRSLYVSFPDFAVTTISTVADEHRGGAEMIMSGTNERENFGMPGTGKPFSTRACAAMDFADGRIARWRDYWSLSSFKRQVGLE